MRCVAIRGDKGGKGPTDWSESMDFLDYHFFCGLLVGIGVTILWPDFRLPKKTEKIEPTEFDWNKLLTDVKSNDFTTRNNTRRYIDKLAESYLAFRLAYNDFLHEEIAKRNHID